MINKIPIYPIVYLLKGDYRQGLEFWGLAFRAYGRYWAFRRFANACPVFVQGAEANSAMDVRNAHLDEVST